MNAQSIWHNAHWVLLTLGLNSAQHFLCKKAADSVPWQSFFQGSLSWFEAAQSILINRYTFFLALCTLPTYGVWFLVLSRIPVSVAVPLLSLNYVVMAWIGFFFFGETISILKVSGIILIIAGVACVVHS